MGGVRKAVDVKERMIDERVLEVESEAWAKEDRKSSE